MQTSTRCTSQPPNDQAQQPRQPYETCCPGKPNTAAAVGCMHLLGTSHKVFDQFCQIIVIAKNSESITSKASPSGDVSSSASCLRYRSEGGILPANFAHAAERQRLFIGANRF